MRRKEKVSEKLGCFGLSLTDDPYLPAKFAADMTT